MTVTGQEDAQKQRQQVLVEETRAHYDQHPLEFIGSDRAVNLRALQPLAFVAFVEALLQPTTRVVDVGCGPGRALAYLGSLGLAPVGCDLSAQSLRLAAGRAPGARLVQASVLALPFADRSFEAVICDGVLHHTPDPPAGFAALCRILKPGGVLYLTIYKRWRYYRYLYLYPGAVFRLLHRFRAGRALLLATVVPLYHGVHLLKSKGDRRWQGSVNFFFDYFLTPQASFHPAREVCGWAYGEGLMRVAYDGDIRRNVHTFVFRKTADNSDREQQPANKGVGTNR